MGSSSSSAIGSQCADRDHQLPVHDRGALDYRQGGPAAAADVSAGLMALCEIALALAFRIQPPPGVPDRRPLLALAGSFAIGLGPGVWVVLSEIFPTRVRGRAMGIATVACGSHASRYRDLPHAGAAYRHLGRALHLRLDVRDYGDLVLEVDTRDQGQDARADREALAVVRDRPRINTDEQETNALSVSIRVHPWLDTLTLSKTCRRSRSGTSGRA